MTALAATYARYPVDFASGRGCVLVDADGHEYLDFLSGVGVCNTGHCHPAVVRAVQEQAGRLMHVSNLFTTAPMTSLAQRLSERSLGGTVFFANSGAEANEAAIKLVRKARRGGEVVVLHGAFQNRFEMCISRPVCSWIACTTCGWQWPVLQTEMPERKSRYSWPSASVSTQPLPETNSTG